MCMFVFLNFTLAKHLIFLFARMWWRKIEFGMCLHNMFVWVSNWQSYSVVFEEIKTWQPFRIISTDNCKQCLNHMVYTKFQIRARIFFCISLYRVLCISVCYRIQKVQRFKLSNSLPLKIRIGSKLRSFCGNFPLVLFFFTVKFLVFAQSHKSDCFFFCFPTYSERHS